MNVLVLNGSPKKEGSVAKILSLFSTEFKNFTIDWVNVYDLSFKPCVGCMKCRETGFCHLPKDDANVIGEKINSADCLIVGSPNYWANMSGQLKLLFERNVPVFIKDVEKGIPIPMQKGKKAILVTACSTPKPFNWLLPQSRMTIKSMKSILNAGGYKVLGSIVQANTKRNTVITTKTQRKINSLIKRI